jgi:hypothetical protein
MVLLPDASLIVGICCVQLSSSPPTSAMAARATEGELQEQLLAWEEELTWREEALAAQVEKAGIAEKDLIKVSADLDAERAKAEATRKEYLDKMEMHIAHTKRSLSLDKMLGVKRLELDG